MCDNCKQSPCMCSKSADPSTFYPEHAKIRSRTTGRKHEIEFGPQPGGLVPKNPFASLAQAGYMHTHPEILGKKGLAEWDAATKGKHLPKHVHKKG